LDRTERFYKIDQLLKSRRIVPLSVFITELGVSRSTVKRDIEYLRDRLLDGRDQASDEVLGPRSLRDKLRLRLEQTQKLYGK